MTHDLDLDEPLVLRGRFLRQTARAIQMQFDEQTVWLPKSQLFEGNEGTEWTPETPIGQMVAVAIPRWLANKQDLYEEEEDL